MSADEHASKYIDCMEEIKLRTKVIYGFIDNTCTAMYVQANAECVALQIRKILELIALASMAANQAEYAKHRRDFHRDWNAKRIFDTLEAVNPNFYPQPSKQNPDPMTGKVPSVTPITEGFLTKQRFIELYDRCSDLLHSQNPFSSTNAVEGFLESVPEWMQEIVTLLNHHQVQLLDEDLQLWVLMQSKEGEVRAWTFQRVSG